ncbi:hypothetical protein JMJ35_003651 [Cladonia borealis]|uniref:Uncharacterized protein n=1 Tax=Cladonia borealis TaxID=184061 RepID=A0AA39V6C7_9LECA|nr:hypothetical protein JMJ35_003651 [Cladonia borealis]
MPRKRIPKRRITFTTPITFFSAKEGKLQWVHDRWYPVTNDTSNPRRGQSQQNPSTASSSTDSLTLSSSVGDSKKLRSDPDGDFPQDPE